MKCPKCGREYSEAEFDRSETYFECEDCEVELIGAPTGTTGRPISHSESLARDEALATASRLTAPPATPGLNPYAAGCLWSLGAWLGSCFVVGLIFAIIRPARIDPERIGALIADVMLVAAALPAFVFGFRRAKRRRALAFEAARQQDIGSASIQVGAPGDSSR